MTFISRAAVQPIIESFSYYHSNAALKQSVLYKALVYVTKAI